MRQTRASYLASVMVLSITMTDRPNFIPEDIHNYILQTMLRESDIARELREVTERLPNARMMSGPDQVQFLQLLVRLIGARRCIEVGVFTGYSALGVALALPPDGRLIACDVSEAYTSVGKPFWGRAGVAQRIDLRLAPALETLQRLIENGERASFDFAYIDADKRSYGEYYERVLELLRPNGLMTIDNVLWSGEVLKKDTGDPDTEALRALNAKIGKDDRVDASIVPGGDGLMVVRKR